MTDIGDTFPPIQAPGEPASEDILLSSPANQRILDAIRTRPGLTLSEAREMVNMSWGSLYRHLVRLEAAGLVRFQTVGRRRILFLTESEETLAQSPVAEAAALLRQPTARTVAVSILMRPGRSVPEVAASLQLTPRVVYHHVQRLLAVGLISSSSQTRHRDLTPSPMLARALDVAEDKVRLGVR